MIENVRRAGRNRSLGAFRLPGNGPDWYDGQPVCTGDRGTAIPATIRPKGQAKGPKGLDEMSIRC